MRSTPPRRSALQLDSIADTLLFLAAAGGIAVFHAEVISKHAVVFTLVPSAWIGENLVALWRYGRLSSFHTYLATSRPARRCEPWRSHWTRNRRVKATEGSSFTREAPGPSSASPYDSVIQVRHEAQAPEGSVHPRPDPIVPGTLT